MKAWIQVIRLGSEEPASCFNFQLKMASCNRDPQDLRRSIDLRPNIKAKLAEAWTRMVLSEVGARKVGTHTSPSSSSGGIQPSTSGPGVQPKELSGTLPGSC